MTERTRVGRFSAAIGHPSDLNLAGLAVTRGRIDKDHTFSMACGLGQLRAQLVQRNNFDFAGEELSLQHFGCPPGCAIVAAQGISICNDEHAGHDLECNSYEYRSCMSTDRALIRSALPRREFLLMD